MSIALRHYSSKDLEQLQLLHKSQGLNYKLPGLDDPIVSCAVIEENGKVTHAMMFRRTAEVFWLFDQNEEKRRDTIGRMLIFHREMPKFLRKLGYEDIHAFVPPEIDGKLFEATMKKLGWEKSEWPCYGRVILK